MKVLDSTFLIDLLRGKKEALRFLEEEQSRDLYTTQINMYEVIRGLFRAHYSQATFQKILAVFADISILPFDEKATIQSASISAAMLNKGTPLSDGDCITAGIALSRHINTIVTLNTKDFEKIPGIVVEEY